MKTCKRGHFYPDDQKQCKTCQTISKKKWNIENKESENSRKKRWMENNKSWVAEYRNKEENKQKIKLLSHKWYENNKERKRRIDAIWCENNKERLNNARKIWAANNKHLFVIYTQNRRSKMRDNGGELSKDIYQKLIVLQKNRCACCKSDLRKTECHLDHIMPIYLGGKHDDINIQLLCAKCNLQKHTKHPIDFMQSKGFLL